MSNSVSRSRTASRSANRWCQLLAWTTILLFALPLKAGVLDSEIMTYQGRLLDSGSPYTGTVDMTFELWTDESGGSMVISQSISGVTVSDGLFQVELTFGSQPYETGLWLEVEADGTTLTPRQRVGAVPLALHSLDGGEGYWDLSGGVLSYDGAVSIQTVDIEALTVNGNTVGVRSSGGGNGVLGESFTPTGIGVQGFAQGDGVNMGVLGTTVSEDGHGVFASNLSEFGTALRAEGDTGIWVEAENTGMFVNAGAYGIFSLGDSIGLYGLAAEKGVEGYSSDADGFGGYFGGVSGSSSYFDHPVGIEVSNPEATLDINGPGVGPTSRALQVSVDDDEKLVVGGLSTSIYQNVFIDGTVAINSFASGGPTDVCHTGSSGSTGVLAECSSSARYKSDIASLGSTTALVERLRPVTFRWTESGEEDFGLVAEEVVEIEPRLVTYNGDGQVEGVKYRQLSALLIRAFQEQRREIDELQEIAHQNSELEARLARLEAHLSEQPPRAEAP